MSEEEILQPAGEVLEEETPVMDAEETEDSSASTEETDGDDTKKTPWFQRRIDEITRQKHEAQREADRLRWELEQAKPKEEPRPAEKDPLAELGAEPREEDFDDYEDFRRAQRAYDRKLAAIEVKAELQAMRAAEQAEAQRQTQAKSLETWTAKGSDKYPDFETVALKHPKDGGPPYSDAMREAVLASDKGHELAYHLGKNPGEARRLTELPPAKAVYELAKLEIKLASIKPKTITDAPGPMKPLSPSKAGETDMSDPSLSMEEFAKRWRAKYKAT